MSRPPKAEPAGANLSAEPEAQLPNLLRHNMDGADAFLADGQASPLAADLVRRRRPV